MYIFFADAVQRGSVVLQVPWGHMFRKERGSDSWLLPGKVNSYWKLDLALSEISRRGASGTYGPPYTLLQ
jgi:hypothetical protein